MYEKPQGSAKYFALHKIKRRDSIKNNGHF